MCHAVLGQVIIHQCMCTVAVPEHLSPFEPSVMHVLRSLGCILALVIAYVDMSGNVSSMLVHAASFNQYVLLWLLPRYDLAQAWHSHALCLGSDAVFTNVFSLS